jgi:hypothetical protein
MLGLDFMRVVVQVLCGIMHHLVEPSEVVRDRIDSQWLSRWEAT